MSSKQWSMVVDKHTPHETWARRGKSEWQDDISVTMVRSRAWSIVRELLGQLERHNDDELIDVYLPGELSEEPDDDYTFGDGLARMVEGRVSDDD